MGYPVQTIQIKEYDAKSKSGWKFSPIKAVVYSKHLAVNVKKDAGDKLYGVTHIHTGFAVARMKRLKDAHAMAIEIVRLRCWSFKDQDRVQKWVKKRWILREWLNGIQQSHKFSPMPADAVEYVSA